jgi:hypothetical protein
MGIYTNRLKSRLAREALREAAKEGKNWIVTRTLILEAEDENGDIAELELNPGDTVEVGADAENNDLAIKSSAAVVVISDEEIAKKVADVLVNSDELSDVKFVDRPALDAIMDGEDTEAVVDKLADAEDDAEDIEVAEIEVEAKESVETKFNKFAKNIIHSDNFLKCEAIQIDEEHDAPLNMSTIKADRVMIESYGEYSKFVKRVSELKGSIQPGEKEVVLSESGKVIGSFDKASNVGKLFLENEFDSVEEMDSFSTEPEMLEQDVEFDMTDDAEMTDDMTVEEKVEACLKGYEESAKSGKDYMELVEGLEKVNLKEGVIKTIAGSFNDRSMKECVRAFDSKYGMFVKTFKESVDCDNFIEETKEAKRFTKRFF